MATPAAVSLSFGIVAAEQDASGAFDALAAWLERRAAVRFTRKPEKTYRALAAGVREGTSDLAWLPPVVYAWLAEAVTPLGAIARDDGATSYAAALVVPEPSPIRALEHLRGKRVGWVDAWSAAGYVVPRIELARAGLIPAATFSEESFHGSHDAAMRALVNGSCDVAATFVRKSDGGEPTVGGWSRHEGLRVLAVLGAIPSDILAARRNLGPLEFERARDALRQACADDEGRDLVRAVFGGARLQEGVGDGHDVLRRDYERALAEGLFD
jgi:phosphate/phosphite/phosphonate ABC transporter binding protein